MTRPEPKVVKLPLPYGFILYRADDAETKRKVEAQHQTQTLKPRLSLRLEGLVR